MVLRLAVLRVVLRAGDFRAVDFLAVLRAGDFRVDLRLAADAFPAFFAARLRAVFLAADALPPLRAAALRAGDFRFVDFLAVFRAVVFRAVVFRAAVFLAGDFLLVVRFAAFLAVDAFFSTMRISRPFVSAF